MDLLLDDIKSTLGATEVSLPAVTSLDDDDRVEEQAEHQALRDAVRSLHLADSESGGVALTGSTMRPSSSRRHFAHPVGVAG
jgi:hypothetical protein